MRFRYAALLCALVLLLGFFGGEGRSFALMSTDMDIRWQAFRLQANPDAPVDAAMDGVQPPGFALAVTLTPPEGSYIYGPEETELGLPTRVNATAAFGGEAPLALSVYAPTPQPLAGDTAQGMEEPPLVYQSPTTFLVFIPNNAGDIALNLGVSTLICTKKSCLPFDRQITVHLTVESIENLPVTTIAALREQKGHSDSVLLVEEPDTNAPVSEGSLETPADRYDFSALQPVYFNPGLEVTALGSALVLGLLAGLILNLMPCVLPVISLKFSALMAVTAMTDKQKQAKAFRKHCLIFAAGILTWFVVLALLIGMAGLAWGELFQNPVVVSILGFILFLLGLSLFGVFNLPIFDLKVSTPANPNWQAFASGLLATLLATPCSGPLLGGVLGWGVRQTLPVLLLTVASVGVGMSLPYVIMACSPRLVHLLPKPGPWTLRLEQLMGFFLMGSVTYLVFLLPSEWVQGYLVALVAVAFSAWLWGQVGHLGASPGVRLMARIGAVLTLLLALWIVRVTSDTHNTWEPFEPNSFSAMLGRDQMLVEFTADWCPSCKAMEQTTLSEKHMEGWRKRFSLRTIRVDLTRDDKAGKALLQALGSSSIPVIALFPKGEASNQPLVLRDIVTAKQLESAMQKVF